MRNRIKELREARGWRTADLGEHLKDPIDSGWASKIERKGDALDISWIKRMAEAFEVDPIEVIDDRKIEFLDAPMVADAERFIPRDSSDQATYEGPDRELWLVKTGVLDELGLTAGEVVLVDTSSGAVAGVHLGHVVLVSVQDATGQSVTLLREFVEPNLLVTNSRAENARPINMKTKLADAQIKGRVLHHIRHLGPVR